MSGLYSTKRERGGRERERGGGGGRERERGGERERERERGREREMKGMEREKR